MVKTIKEIGGILKGIFTGQAFFLLRLSQFTKKLKDQGEKTTIGKLANTALYPGDLVYFTYDGRERAVLILSQIFASSKGNRLVAGIQLEGSDVVIHTVVKRLYKKRGKASYRFYKKSMALVKSLKVLLGEKNYRTFNINITKMQNLHSINIKS